jgi:hypothetical protein
MASTFGTDILIQAPDPRIAAVFCVKHLNLAIPGWAPDMISLHGNHINLFIERGPAQGPVLEVTVEDVESAKRRLVEIGCRVVKDEPDVPRCCINDASGLIYNLTH